MDPKERQNRTRAEPPALLADCCGYAKPCAAPPRQAMRRPTQDAYASHPGPLQRFWEPGARPQIGVLLIIVIEIIIVVIIICKMVLIDIQCA